MQGIAAFRMGHRRMQLVLLYGWPISFRVCSSLESRLSSRMLSTLGRLARKENQHCRRGKWALECEGSQDGLATAGKFSTQRWVQCSEL